MSTPAESTNRIETDCGSSAVNRTEMPPWLGEVRTWNRVTGRVATSRSSTRRPAALRPTMIARFNIRAAREESREVVTVDPFGKVVAYAIATRFASPVTPTRPKRDWEPRVSQMIDVVIVASESTTLFGYTLTPEVITAWVPT